MSSRAVPIFDRVGPIVDRLGANNGRGIGAIAVLALWLVRRVPAVAFPIRAALFLGRFLPVALWLVRRYESRRPVSQPAPERRAARPATLRNR